MSLVLILKLIFFILTLSLNCDSFTSPRLVLPSLSNCPFLTPLRTNFCTNLLSARDNPNLSNKDMKKIKINDKISPLSIPKKEYFREKLKEIIPSTTERKKIFPLGFMFFCILFNYTILRDTKDVLMVTAPKSGAEVIPFIKTYVNLPMAISFTAIYTQLCDKLEQKNVFYLCTIPFLVFFGIFATIIYPNNQLLHPHKLIDSFASYLPSGFVAPLSVVRNWSFALFYVMAEMWGSVVLSLLFWGLANEVTTVNEARKYYPLFGMGANVALILSGQYIKWVSQLRSKLPTVIDAWGISLKYLMGAVIASGSLMIGTYNHLQQNVVKNPKCVDKKVQRLRKDNKKDKMGLRESAKFIFKSSYIRELATLVICYGMCINIVEVSWKSKLKQAFPNPNDYGAFMGNFSSVTGAVTLIMMFLGRTVFQKFGWRKAALVTPTMIGITSASFFALQAFSSTLSPMFSALGTTPIMVAVFVGAAQNIMSKSCKYSFFDPCKEMAYIPLDQDSKTKGKAAVDVVGNPLGKSGGSLIQQILIFSVGSLVTATPVSLECFTYWPFLC